MRTVIAAALACLVSTLPAQAQSVQWASQPADTSSANTAAVTGEPDGIATSISFFAASYVRDFRQGRVTAAQIERLLKLPAGELSKWDILAFESKSPSGGTQPFDSAMWMVTDTQRIASAAYDGQTKAAVPGTGTGWSFRSGGVAMADFKALFPGKRVFGDAAWILIKLPATVNKRSPNLAVWLSGGPLPSANADPAPDAIAVIR